VRNGSFVNVASGTWTRSGETGSDSGTFQGATSARYISDSGYRGKRPKVLVPHNFQYLVKNLDVTFVNVFETFRPVNFNTSTVTRGGYLSPSQANGWSLVIPDDTYVYNQLIDELYEKIRGGIDLSVDVAEAGQTRKMLSVSNQVTSFAKSAAMKYGPARLAAGAWLQLQYGWKPLLGTLYEAADRASNVVINQIERVTVRKNQQFDNPELNVISYEGYPDRFRTKSKGKIGYTLGMAYDTSFNSAQRLGQWTSLNPASIAWELMPYSFVVDWFIDIGGYLRNLESSLLYANVFRDGFISRIIACDGTVNDVYSNGDHTYRNTFSPRGNFTYRDFNRSVLTSTPAPRMPSFRANLGSSRLLSAAALLSNFLPKHR